jgi:hypothetical protein
MLRMLTVCFIILRNKSFRYAGASGTVSDVQVPAVQFHMLNVFKIFTFLTF